MATSMISAFLGSQTPTAKAEGTGLKAQGKAQAAVEETAAESAFQALFGILSNPASTVKPLALSVKGGEKTALPIVQPEETGEDAASKSAKPGKKAGTSRAHTQVRLQAQETEKIDISVPLGTEAGDQSVAVETDEGEKAEAVSASKRGDKTAPQTGKPVTPSAVAEFEGKASMADSPEQETPTAKARPALQTTHVPAQDAVSAKGPAQESKAGVQVPAQGSDQAESKVSDVPRPDVSKATPSQNPVVQEAAMSVQGKAQTSTLRPAVQVPGAQKDRAAAVSESDTSKMAPAGKSEAREASTPKAGSATPQPLAQNAGSGRGQAADPHQAVRAFHKQVTASAPAGTSRESVGEKKGAAEAALEVGERSLKTAVQTSVIQNEAKTAVERTPVALRDAVVEQVRPALTTLVRQGDSRMTLTLKPESLGQVQIEVESSKGLVEVRFLVETTEAKTLIDHSIPELKAALGREGLETGGLQVNVASDFAAESESQRRQYRESGRRRTEAGNGNQVAEPEESVKAVRRARQFGYNSMELEA